MNRIRQYWLDCIISALAIAALAIGIVHHAERSPASTVYAGQRAGLPASALTNRISENTAFSVDTVSSGLTSTTFGGIGTFTFSTRKGDVVAVTGWAVDQPAQAPASAVMLQLGSGERINAQYGVGRPDVARVLGVAAYVSSGFSALIPTTHLKGGRYGVSLLVFDAKKTGYYFLKDRVVLNLH